MRDMTRDMYLWVWISKDCMAAINWGKDVTLTPQRTWRSIKAAHLKAWNSSPILELWQNRQGHWYVDLTQYRVGGSSSGSGGGQVGGSMDQNPGMGKYQRTSWRDGKSWAWGNDLGWQICVATSIDIGSVFPPLRHKGEDLLDLTLGLWSGSRCARNSTTNYIWIWSPWPFGHRLPCGSEGELCLGR